jgi:Peptidase inhibitor family I36
MHIVPVARKVSLSALVALALLAGALFVATPKASANKEDCPSGDICLWSGPTFGTEPRAFFTSAETGCKPLNNINPRSAFNNSSSRTAEFPGFINLGPGRSWENAPEPGWQFNMCIR